MNEIIYERYLDIIRILEKNIEIRIFNLLVACIMKYIVFDQLNAFVSLAAFFFVYIMNGNIGII